MSTGDNPGPALVPDSPDLAFAILSDEPCEAFLVDESIVSGTLSRFTPERENLEILRRNTGLALWISFARLRVLGLSQVAAIAGGVSLQTFRVDFKALTLRGECSDYQLIDEGLWLSVADLERQWLVRWFVPWKNCIYARAGPEILFGHDGLHAHAGPVYGDLDRLWDALRRGHHITRDIGLGESLVREGVISAESFHDALQKQRAAPAKPIGKILIESGVLTEARLRMAYASTLGLPVVDLAAVTAEPKALACLSRAQAERVRALPLEIREQSLVVAFEDPWDSTAIDEVRFQTNMRLYPVLAAPLTLDAALAVNYERMAASPNASRSDIHAIAAELVKSDIDIAAEDAEIDPERDNTLVRLVNTMIDDAILRKASDIHIESELPPQPVRIRFRIDGLLVPYLELLPKYRRAVIARLKIMSDLDISEHRKPQDGKIDFARFGGQAMEIRIVTVPTSRGLEDAVLRLLGGMRPLPMDRIGLSPVNLLHLHEQMLKPYGLILICGPTGSGKTTTLHSILQELNDGERKIWTAEDPIEIKQYGLRQVQINTRIGWTFAAAMRTFLRADPDVVMIGEMRDQDTANVAIEASLTGHLVMSTLHTNSAAQSVARLIEMGIDTFNFSDALLAVLAQRLVRVLCVACKEAYTPDAPELASLAHAYLHSGRRANEEESAGILDKWIKTYGNAEGKITLYRKKACPECEQRGYRGRMGIYELLLPDDAIRMQIRQRESGAGILIVAISTGMITLRQDGIEKVLQGKTDFQEILAATGD